MLGRLRRSDEPPARIAERSGCVDLTRDMIGVSDGNAVCETMKESSVPARRPGAGAVLGRWGPP